MELVNGNGLDPEAEAKTTTVEGELAGVTGGDWPGDDLFVDEILDFSNGLSETEEPPPESEPENGETAQEKQSTPVSENHSFVAGDNFASLHASELSVQEESLESLEWLSHFVEDSFPDYSHAGKFKPPPTANRPEPQVPADHFATPVQTKARTKRARTGVRVKPVLSPSLAELDTPATSSASSTTWFSPPNKRRMKPADGGLASSAQRRCIHCGVTKTPQWRTGPCGPKTLCNACGVRFKSGRLLPEYRPACSPTFSSELHSNNHRKVLEMRRKKEVETEGTGMPPPVKSF